MPQQEISHYRLLRKLGEGGMGEVYLAEDTRLERNVALKLLPAALALDARRRQRFLTEAKAASALSHPNVCVVHEVGETEDHRPYLVMEYLEGGMLDARIRQGPLPMAELISVGQQIADALDAAHARGVIHRDIKPANISLNARGVVKVLDFGLAKRTARELSGDSEVPTQMLTRTGAVMGTPAYMSPEQVLGRAVDGRSDLFSLGVVLFELATGQLPFAGANIGEVLDKIVHHQPMAVGRLNYDVPEELERIIRKCLEKDPGRRYQSAREILVDLRNLLRDVEGERPPSERLSARPSSPEPALAKPGATESGPAHTPEEIKKSDLFINCAQLDNRPLTIGQPGWVSQFQRNLEIRLQQLSGEDVKVCSHPAPSGGPSLDPQLLASVPQAKTMVSVVSPPFVKSEACRLEAESFWREAEREGNLMVESRPRLFKVVKTPVDPEAWPPQISQMFSRLMSFEFFERDPETGRVREFDESFGDRARQRYHERIYDLAHEISTVLRGFRRTRGPAGSDAPAGTATGKAIFLAMTTADQQEARDQLQRALIELGHQVLPTQPLPIIASELETSVRQYLRDSDLAIHLMGERYGLVPEDADRSVVVLQNEWAAEQSLEAGLERVIWMPRGLQPRDERQAEFVRRLVREDSLHAGAEIIVDTLENLKGILEEKWRQDDRKAAAPAARSREGPARVYLICDASDEQAVEPIEDFLFTQGIEVCLPAFDLDEAKAQEAHLENLRDCDAALIYYGQASRAWVDIKLRDLLKANAYRSSQPIEVRAVYVAPPFDRRKERFRSLSAALIKQEGVFDPNTLGAFASELKLKGDG